MPQLSAAAARLQEQEQAFELFWKKLQYFWPAAWLGDPEVKQLFAQTIFFAGWDACDNAEEPVRRMGGGT